MSVHDFVHIKNEITLLTYASIPPIIYGAQQSFQWAFDYTSAMMLYHGMTAEDFYCVTACKIEGTWNLHNVALELKSPLEFFLILSSAAGVAEQSGQANCVATNAFLSTFAIYSRTLGILANSIALRPIWVWAT